MDAAWLAAPCTPDQSCKKERKKGWKSCKKKNKGTEELQKKKKHARPELRKKRKRDGKVGKRKIKSNTPDQSCKKMKTKRHGKDGKDGKREIKTNTPGLQKNIYTNRDEEHSFWRMFCNFFLEVLGLGSGR